MSKIVETRIFAGVDDTVKDDKITFSLLENRGVLVCIRRDEKILFNAMIEESSWAELINSFKEA